MNRLVLIIPMVLACSRTSLGLHAPDGSYPGLGGSGGTVVVPPASGGSPGKGGAGGGTGGANMGSGGILGAGGAAGRGGAPGSVNGSPDGSLVPSQLSLEPSQQTAFDGQYRLVVQGMP